MNLKGLCGITFVLLFLVIKIYFGRDNILPLLISLHIVPPLTVIKLLIRPGQTEKLPRQTAV